MYLLSLLAWVGGICIFGMMKTLAGVIIGRSLCEYSHVCTNGSMAHTGSGDDIWSRRVVEDDHGRDHRYH